MLVLTHDGPTRWRETTTMTASVATGSNVIYDWTFDDGYLEFGPVVTRTFPAPGDHTVVVTASNSVSLITATMIVPVRDVIYMPLVVSTHPDPCADEYERDDSPLEASSISTEGESQQHTFHRAEDEDWIAFDVSDPDFDYVIETFQLEGADTVIYLYDSDGVALLDWNDDVSPSSLASYLYFNPYHAGTFYAKIVNYDPQVSGCAIAYSVRVTAQQQGVPRGEFPVDQRVNSRSTLPRAEEGW